jgi:uncharacterized BrkB/YihY/UPF0761 family membrane protein
MRTRTRQAGHDISCFSNGLCLYWTHMISAALLSKRGLRIFARVFPRCGMISQAIAFNLFLAFFPTLLLTVAIATSRWGSHTNLLDLIAPLLIAAILGVFGRPLRHWITDRLGESHPFHGLWTFFFPVAAFVLSLAALTMIFRVARPQETSLRDVIPGAIVATLLWWLVDVLFGFYVRRVPYSLVYGGLAAVIGLLIWMNLSAIIIFLGAAWNAEAASIRASRAVPGHAVPSRSVR